MYTTTLNGDLALDTSENAIVDAFYRLGSMRNPTDDDRADALMFNAMTTDPKRAALLSYYLRHPRGGMSERRRGLRSIMQLFTMYPAVCTLENMVAVATYGSWKDVVKMAQTIDTLYAPVAQEALVQAIKAGDRLACKWAPREKTNPTLARTLRSMLGFSNKEYRRHLSNVSETVEQQMCSGKFSDINYSTVPSRAGLQYKKAFQKRDNVRYQAFLEDKTQKANASVIQPHEVYVRWKQNRDDLFADKLWDNLPQLGEMTQERILPMVDVSPSMNVPAAGKTTCMDVSISLGLYLAEQITGPFSGQMLTFSGEPRLIRHTGDSIAERFKSVSQMAWGGSTDIAAAFRRILESAELFSIPQELMPTMLLILSDMQFNQNQMYGTLSEREPALLMQEVEQAFKAKGYTAPKLAFWNLNGGYETIPASSRESNVCLVSGFSPQILTAALNAEVLTPENVVDEALSQIDIDLSMLS